MDAAADPQPDAGPLDGRERELKFEAHASALTRIGNALRKTEGAAKRGVATRLISVYFDTADQLLARHGVSLRIRRKGRAYIQTIKRSSGGVGLFDRAEWERRSRGPELALTMDEQALLGSILGREDGSAPLLQPVFTVAAKRTIYDVRRGEFAAEIALDEATIEAGETSHPFCELELELLSGDSKELFGLARELFGLAPIRVSALAKSERGYAALAGQLGVPVKAGTSPITPDMTVEEAFLAAVGDCLRQYRLNENVLLNGPDPKATHQARVALRRMRSTFSVFAAAVSDERSLALKEGLKWLAGALSDARDLDVFIERHFADPEALADDPGQAALAARLGKDRDAAYAAAAKALQAPRSRELMLDLVEWLALGAWRSTPETAELRAAPIASFAAEVLTKRRKKVKKSGKELEKLSPYDRHQVRIEAKKLRYATDFFEHVFVEGGARKRYAAFSAGLAELQEDLGLLNDIATARDLTRKLAHGAVKAGDADQAFAAGVIAGEGQARAAKLLSAAAKNFSALMKADPFWSRKADTPPPARTPE